MAKEIEKKNLLKRQEDARVKAMIEKFLIAAIERDKANTKEPQVKIIYPSKAL